MHTYLYLASETYSLHSDRRVFRVNNEEIKMIKLSVAAVFASSRLMSFMNNTVC